MAVPSAGAAGSSVTGSTEFIDNTTAAVYIPDIWSQLSIVAREQALVLANLVDRRYEDGLRFGDTIRVGTRSHLSARQKTLSSNAAITYETITEGHSQISINRWFYVAIGIEDIVKVQANRDMLKMYTEELGYALALEMDDYLASFPDDFSNAVGTLAVELTDDDVLRARQYLDDANAPEKNRFMGISPAQENGLLKMDRYVHNDYAILHGNGPRTTDLEFAYVRSFYDIPIYKTTNIEGSNAAGHDNFLLHKEALALVQQMKVKTRMQGDIDYLTDKVAMEHVYGATELRDDHGCFMRGA